MKKTVLEAAWHKKTYAAKGAKQFCQSKFELKLAAKMPAC